MADATDRIAALTGVAVSEIIGPIVVDTSRLYGNTGQVTWSTTVYNVRALTASGDGAAPIIFSAQDGQLSLAMSASLDWRFHAEFTANWPTTRRFRWESTLAGNGQTQGQIDPVGQTDLWYFSTPAAGPDGELVIDITATGVQDPGEEWQLTELTFWLFR